MILVPDTSVVVDGRFLSYIVSHAADEVIVPEAVVAEIEHLASMGKSSGVSGLAELLRLRDHAVSEGLMLTFHGKRPLGHDIEYARTGAVDDIIRGVAADFGATLVTGDRVQAQVAAAKGIEVAYLEPYVGTTLRIEDLFDPDAMSVHLKAGCRVFSKKGRPGAVVVDRTDTVLSEHELEDIALDIIERAKNTRDCFIEMDEPGATVVQLREYRIAITKPPFSDKYEITAVRPVRKVPLDEYAFSSQLKERLSSAEGILVSGAPGAGKSTFVQAIAEHYHALGKIVKTMEKPRDLQVSDEITQYTALSGDMAKTGDILLLVRPDYTIFDEMRKTSDFIVYADLRLAGVGMIGVVHATRTIDAIQRFIGRIELGMIPQIVDTVVHIDGGQVQEIFTLTFTVKVPSGMTESDLARPVIEVFSFEDRRLQYEIYTFGEQVVVMAVGGGRGSRQHPSRKAQRNVEAEVRALMPDAEVQIEVRNNRVVIRAQPEDMPYLIGKKGKSVARLEARLGMKVDVVEAQGPEWKEELPVYVKAQKKYYVLSVDKHYAGRSLAFFSEGRELFQGTTNKKGSIKIENESDMGTELSYLVQKQKFIYAVPV